MSQVRSPSHPSRCDSERLGRAFIEGCRRRSRFCRAPSIFAGTKLLGRFGSVQPMFNCVFWWFKCGPNGPTKLRVFLFLVLKTVWPCLTHIQMMLCQRQIFLVMLGVHINNKDRPEIFGIIWYDYGPMAYGFDQSMIKLDRWVSIFWNL